MRVKIVFERLAIVLIVFTLLQVPYFITCEIIKATGQYSDFYYPKGTGDMFGWILLILILYTPFCLQYYFCRKMIQTCIKSMHPTYDFTRSDGYVIVPKSIENSIGLKLGLYKEHSAEGGKIQEESELSLIHI